jgi:serine/threonine-protein kinase
LSNIEPTPFGDKYLLVEHIATGGMAEIYRAQYAGIEGFAKELVVKTLREEFAARQDVVQMFLGEARVAATLTHNNVVHTYDLGEIGGEYFIAMELLKGEELVNVMRRSFQQKRPLPVELAVGIIMQSCEGLHYVHTRTDEGGNPLGLVHRDINPTNIHVGYDGVCKILDFGIAATRASAVAKKGEVAGKLSYMAPEQLRGEVIDARADVFPLGVVMYELCLGRRLFRGQRDDVMRRVLEGDVPPPTFVNPSFPPALEAIIMRALEVDPADRYQNCDHMFRDLEAFLAEETLTSSPRKLSAVMVDLFGEGAPAVVDYDDMYDDLESDALDFEQFEAVSDDDDDAPDWARELEVRSPAEPSPKRRRARQLTIGNLEALVVQGKFDESGAHPVVPPAESDSASSGMHKTVPLDGDAPASAEESGRAKRPTTGSNRRAGARRPASGGRPRLRPSGPPSGASPVSPMLTTGPLTPVSDNTTGFGQGVVRRKTGGIAWAWIIGIAVLGGFAYLAYTLVTAK